MKELFCGALWYSVEKYWTNINFYLIIGGFDKGKSAMCLKVNIEVGI